jgi:hypothetical protein
MCATTGRKQFDNQAIMPLVTTPLENPPLAWSKMAPAILWGGLIAGAMDITAAFITAGLRGATPVRVLQFVASGLLGPSSFQSGASSATLGMLIHFFIAFSATTVFYVASRKMAFLTQQPATAGVLYGVTVYLVMYWVVTPLSAVRRGPFSWNSTIVAVLTHIFCVGLPIALSVRRFSK